MIKNGYVYLSNYTFNGVFFQSTEWKPQTYRKSLITFIMERCIEYTSPLTEVELASLSIG